MIFLIVSKELNLNEFATEMSRNVPVVVVRGKTANQFHKINMIKLGSYTLDDLLK